MWFNFKKNTRLNSVLLANSVPAQRIRRGFTLIEVMVSLGIMVAMFSVVLSSQSTYTSTAALNNVVDDVYLSLRQAQVYGVGVKEFTPGSVEFDVSYGLSFDISPNGSNDSFIFFADRGDRNEMYDSGWNCPIGEASECISKTQFGHEVTIKEICFIRTNDSTICNIGRVDVTFARPNPEAQIIVFNPTGNPRSQPNNLKGVSIEAVSPNGKSRTIIVYTTGQISTQ